MYEIKSIVEYTTRILYTYVPSGPDNFSPPVEAQKGCGGNYHKGAKEELTFNLKPNGRPKKLDGSSEKRSGE